MGEVQERFRRGFREVRKMFVDVRERQRKEWTSYKGGNRTIRETTYGKKERRKK